MHSHVQIVAATLANRGVLLTLTRQAAFRVPPDFDAELLRLSLGAEDSTEVQQRKQVCSASLFPVVLELNVLVLRLLFPGY